MLVAGRRSRALAVSTVAVCASVVVVSPAAAKTKLKHYSNCAQLNAKYPHGVGKSGAQDKTSDPPPVKNFRVNTKLYKANKSLDRDGDGVACEKH